MFEFRQTADYKDLAKFDEQDVKIWLDKASKFITELILIIKKACNFS